MERERGVTPGIIDELHSWDIQGDQMEGGSVVSLEVSLRNLILRISKDIKWKEKVILLEISLMTFIFRIFEEIKWRVEVGHSKCH